MLQNIWPNTGDISTGTGCAYPYGWKEEPYGDGGTAI